MSVRDLSVYYARLSQRGEEEASIDRQIGQSEAEAKKRKTTSIGFVESKGHRSGRSEKNRPAWLDCKAYIQTHAKRIKCFIVQDTDRVSRNVLERLAFLKQLKDLGIEYVSLLEPHLAQQMPASERNLMDTMTAAVSQHYADWLSEKQRNACAYIKEKGGKLGNPPRGLTAQGGGIHRQFVRGDKKVLKTLEQILLLYVTDNIGGEEVVRRAVRMGLKLPDRRGVERLVQHTDWQSLLRRLTYYDGIMEASLLTRVRERLKERSSCKENGRRVNTRAHDTILRRLLFCELCGSRLWSVGAKARADRFRTHYEVGPDPSDPYAYRYFRHGTFPCTCSEAGKYYRGIGMEDEVWSDLARVLILTEEQKQHIAALAAQPHPSSNNARRRDLEKKLRRLEETWLDEGNVDGALLTKERYIELRREIADEMHSIPPEYEGPLLAEADALARLNDMAGLLQDRASRNPGDVNNVLRAVFERIMVIGGHVVRYEPRAWCKLLFPKEMTTSKQTGLT